MIGEDGRAYRTSQATVWGWRRMFQNNFASRMQWTLTSNFSEAGHPPVIRVNGQAGPEAMIAEAEYNQTMAFDASETYNPDYLDDNR